MYIHTYMYVTCVILFYIYIVVKTIKFCKNKVIHILNVVQEAVTMTLTFVQCATVSHMSMTPMILRQVRWTVGFSTYSFMCRTDDVGGLKW